MRHAIHSLFPSKSPMTLQPEKPDFTEYHKSITAELHSLKDRIRQLVRHWPTDGEYKEFALRSVLRRHLPQSTDVGRGFIVTENGSSSQIDILIVDNRKPMLFREGDLMIVTPDAVLAIVEVKTEVRDGSTLRHAIEKLAMIKQLIGRHENYEPIAKRIWSGIFDFSEAGLSHPVMMGAIGRANFNQHYPINSISLGKSAFIRFWESGDDVRSLEPDGVWHSYELPEVAPSYFIGNLVDSISPLERSDAGYAWFPVLGGKEQHRKMYLPRRAVEPLLFQ
ncbi:MAG: DUF6602 domain-containing protein [Cyanobacteriota bacterium]